MLRALGEGSTALRTPESLLTPNHPGTEGFQGVRLVFHRPEGLPPRGVSGQARLFISAICGVTIQVACQRLSSLFRQTIPALLKSMTG